MEPTGVGIYVKSRDRVGVLDAVRTAMEAEGLEWVGGGVDAPSEATRLLLLPPTGDWTPLYPATATRAGLAGDIAIQLKVPVFVVGHLEDMAFYYAAWDTSGNLVDEYHSCPDYAKDFDEPDADADELARTRGKPQVVASLLGASDKAGELGAVLEKARIDNLREHDPASGFAGASEPLRKLGKMFGLPDLQEEFDVLWDLGPDEDDEDDVRYLAYAPPREPGRLERFLGRFKGKDDDAVRCNEDLDDDELGDDDDLGDDDLADDDDDL